MGKAEIIDITKDMTLEEIRARHLDNFHLLTKEFKTHRFHTAEKAQLFGNMKIHVGLKKLGVDQPALFGKYYPHSMNKLYKEVQKALDTNNVKAETFGSTYNERAGMYLHHNNEIVYFISDPIFIEGSNSHSGLIVVPTRLETEDEYHVVTNVP